MTHPITPPPMLVHQWSTASPVQSNDENWAYELFIAHCAAQWGADQELEACCEYLVRCAQWEPEDVAELRAARRLLPKPPSLKQQGLDALRALPCQSGALEAQSRNTIRRALEALPDD